jgi:hypothetical protein
MDSPIHGHLGSVLGSIGGIGNKPPFRTLVVFCDEHATIEVRSTRPWPVITEPTTESDLDDPGEDYEFVRGVLALRRLTRTPVFYRSLRGS